MAQNFWPHPMLNVHIVEMIFHQCDIRTLLTCRLVCHTWNYEAIRNMERNGTTALVKGENSIEKFLNCIQTSNSHPFSIFSIELPAVTLKKQFQITLDLIFLLKDKMRQVKFDYEIPTENDVVGANDEIIDDENETLSPNCSITLPILESLHLFSTNIFPPKSPNGLPKLFNLLKTPRLTSLSVQHLYAIECASTVAKFLSNNSSPISVLRMPCTEFPKVVGVGNSIDIHHLNELDICNLFHGSFSTNETIRCIRENCPNLKSLAVELGIHVTFDAIFKLLETLAHSLTNLKLMIQDKNLLSRNVQQVNFYFPCMPQLQSLFLRYANPGLVYFIDEMPMLNTLELDTPWTRKVKGHLFPGVDSKVYDKLQTLNFSEKLTAQDVQIMRRLFPNLKTLCSSFKSNDALLEVFKNYGELDCLIVDRNSLVEDQCICGLSSEDLSNILEVECSLTNNHINGGISITNLRCLKSLKLMQLGLSWKSLVFGISYVFSLQSLTVQATTLKMGGADLNKDDRVLQHLSQHLPKLRNLYIWIRRNSERLIPEEIEFLSQNYPQWRIEFTIQTVCSVV